MSNYSEGEIKDLLKPFVGKQKQVPPMYSALKYKGETLYRLAREKLASKDEIKKILEEKVREIEIYNIEVLNIDNENNVLTIKVECSSGTYIRTLVEDIAEKAFKTVGTVSALNRVSVGKFNIKNSYKILEFLSSIDNKLNKEEKKNKSIKKNKSEKYIIDIEDAFIDFSKTRIEESRVYYFTNGVRITNQKEDGLYRVYSFKKENQNKQNLDNFIGLGLTEENLMKRVYIYED